jgi:hypothetical protein
MIKVTKDIHVMNISSTITPLINKHKVKAHGYLVLSMYFFPILLLIYFQSINNFIIFINSKRQVTTQQQINDLHYQTP